MPQRYRIPRILHFTWGLLEPERPLPKPYRDQIENWQQRHPEWEIRIHDGHAMRCLAEEFPEIPYDAYARAIQRCDVCRPMLLARHGGVYADLDVTPLDSLETVIREAGDPGALLLTEVVLSVPAAVINGLRRRIRRGRPERRRRIANYLMASEPGHAIWQEVLGLLSERAALSVREDYDVIYTTGPDVITEALTRLRDRADVRVLDADRSRACFHHAQDGGWRTDGLEGARS